MNYSMESSRFGSFNGSSRPNTNEKALSSSPARSVPMRILKSHTLLWGALSRYYFLANLPDLSRGWSLTLADFFALVRAFLVLSISLLRISEAS